MIDQAMELKGKLSEKIKILPLEEILDFNNPEIQDIFDIKKTKEGEIKTKLKKTEEEASEKFTSEKLKQLEVYLEGKNFSLKLADWELVEEIIQNHPDYEMEDEYGVPRPSKKMDNIYSNFPELLLALYFKNKTGVDYRELREIFEKEEVQNMKKIRETQIIEEMQKVEISEKYSIEKIEKFIEVVKNSLIIFNKDIEELRVFYRNIETENKILENKITEDGVLTKKK